MDLDDPDVFAFLYMFYMEHLSAPDVNAGKAMKYDIYITGDCHQDFERFNIDVFQKQKYGIVSHLMELCGGVWNKTKKAINKAHGLAGEQTIYNDD